VHSTIRLFRRVVIQPNHVGYFLHEQRIGGHLTVSVRWGLSPRFCQIRAIVGFERRDRSAIDTHD
jgi:hypothetical protein